MFERTRNGAARGARGRFGSGASKQPPRAPDFADRRVVFFAQGARPVGEHIANHPHAMLHVVEGDQSEIEHHHAIVQATSSRPVAGMRSIRRTMS